MSPWSHDPFSAASRRKRRRGLFDLAAPVGPRGRNRRDDVIKVESLLAESGDHDPTPTDGPTGYFGPRLKDGIERYQSRSGLRTDGLLNPGGPTLSTLRSQLQSRLAGRRAPTPEEVEDHHRRRAKGLDSPLAPKPEPPRLRPPTRPLKLDDRSFSGNRRLVDHLATTREDGMLPRLVAEVLTGKGASGEAGLRDFMDQLGKRDPHTETLGRRDLAAYLIHREGMSEARSAPCAVVEFLSWPPHSRFWSWPPHRPGPWTR